jgi:hypothetical protein
MNISTRRWRGLMPFVSLFLFRRFSVPTYGGRRPARLVVRSKTRAARFCRELR